MKGPCRTRTRFKIKWFVNNNFDFKELANQYQKAKHNAGDEQHTNSNVFHAKAMQTIQIIFFLNKY